MRKGIALAAVIAALALALAFFEVGDEQHTSPIAPAAPVPAERSDVQQSESTALSVRPPAPTVQEIIGDDLTPWVERALAEDIDTAFYLGRTLMDCKTLLRQVQGKQMYEHALHAIATSARDPAEVERFKREYRTCERNRSLVDSGIDWMTQAADAGHTDAQIWFEAAAEIHFEPTTDEVRAWYRQKADRYLRSARDNGSIEAMVNLTDRLEAVDPIAAYAHILLAERVILDSYAHANTPLYEQIQVKRMRERRLNRAQRSEARARAEEMYLRCCKG